jgi:hypothetical protein
MSRYRPRRRASVRFWSRPSSRAAHKNIQTTIMIVTADTTRAVAVAVRQPLLAPLAALGADQLRHLHLHQLLHDPEQTLSQEVEPLLLEQVADDLLSRHPLRLGHRGAPFVVDLARNRRV